MITPDTPIPPHRNELWRHYKGRLYRVWMLSTNEDGQKEVIYHDIQTGKTYNQPLTRWQELLDGSIPRFVRHNP
jgi:hypothetical protein